MAAPSAPKPEARFASGLGSGGRRRRVDHARESRRLLGRDPTEEPPRASATPPRSSRRRATRRDLACDLRITPSASTFSPFASSVAPVVVMSTISFGRARGWGALGRAEGFRRCGSRPRHAPRRSVLVRFTYFVATRIRRPWRAMKVGGGFPRDPPWSRHRSSPSEPPRRHPPGRTRGARAAPSARRRQAGPRG